MDLLSFPRFWTLSIERFWFFILICFERRDTENQQLAFVLQDSSNYSMDSKSHTFAVVMLKETVKTCQEPINP